MGWRLPSALRPGLPDKLSIEGGRYVVNGQPTNSVSPLGRYRPALDIPSASQTLSVPPGCYFVVQDNTQHAFDSQVLSWAKEHDLIGTRAIIVVGQGAGKEVQ